MKSYHIIPVKLGNGAQGWQVYNSSRATDGKRWRKTFRSRQAAEEELAKALYADDADRHDNYPVRFPRDTYLSQSEIAMAEQAYARLQDLFQPGETILNTALLLDAVNFYVEHRKKMTARKETTLTKALEEFLLTKKTANRRERTVANLEDRIGRFIASRKNANVSSITNQDVSVFLTEKGKGSYAKRNDRAAIGNFFSWAVKHHYCENNPVANLETIDLDDAEPVILTLKQCVELLETSKRYRNGICLPYVALSLFAGIRPAEISRLESNQINLDEGTVTVRGSVAKMRARRIVTLSNNAIAWLRLTPTVPLYPPRYHWDAVRKLAGFQSRTSQPEHGKTQFVPDSLRHTAITHHLGLTNDEGKTARWAGNSPDVIHRHYLSLVSPEDTKAFWAIMPKEQ